MLMALAYSHADSDLAADVLEWCREMEPVQPHRCLLVSSFHVDGETRKTMIERAKSAFAEVIELHQPAEEETGWPHHAKALFRGSYDWVKKNNAGHWLWLEPDCVPLCPGWLTAIDHEYQKRGKAFMGTVYEHPRRHFNGVMVYPENIERWHPFMLNGSKLSWDLVRPEIVMRNGHNTHLIQRMLADPRTNPPTPMSFSDADSLSAIRPGVVLFHGVKDGSLIKCLRNPTALPPPKRIGAIIRKIITQRETIAVRRTGAIGDALAATCVASRLVEKGFRVEFQCAEVLHPLMRLCPGIVPTLPNRPPDVNLDGVYENDPQRSSRHFAEMFTAKANADLKPRRLSFGPLNIAPVISVTEKSKAKYARKFMSGPKPWIFFVPRSNSFAARTVPDKTWEKVAALVPGTRFWLATHAPPPIGFSRVEAATTAHIGIALASSDLVVSVDTGPLHIAAALGKPCIAICQSSSPELHLSDQRDFTVISPENLSCLNCQKENCPINASHPPCQDISPDVIATAVNRRLRGGVSAVIATFKAPAVRLNKCILSVLDQVDEVVVTVDRAGNIPDGVLTHPKVRYVTTRLAGIGYGRNCNFGVRHTFGEWILTINDDAHIDPGAVEKMLAAVKDDKVAAVGCLLWYPGRTSIQHGGTTRKVGDLGWGHIDHRKSVPSITEVTEMENVTLAVGLIRRTAFYGVMGHDERYFAYYEDNDLCLELRKRGWKVLYTPHAQAIHEDHGTTAQMPEMAEKVRESKALFASKWKAYFDWNHDRTLGNFDYL